MCPWVGSHAPSFGRQLSGAAQPCGISHSTGGNAPGRLQYAASPLWLVLQGPAAWQTTPSSTVCRLACQQWFPWLRVIFFMVPDAALLGSDQRPWNNAPATGPVGRVRRSSVAGPWGVV